MKQLVFARSHLSPLSENLMINIDHIVSVSGNEESVCIRTLSGTWTVEESFVRILLRIHNLSQNTALAKDYEKRSFYIR